MKNIIIFGGTGFLGSWIVKNFIESGYKVTIFDLKIELKLLKNLIGNDIEKIIGMKPIDITKYKKAFVHKSVIKNAKMQKNKKWIEKNIMNDDE